MGEPMYKEPISAQRITKPPLFNLFPTRPIIKKLSIPAKAITSIRTIQKATPTSSPKAIPMASPIENPTLISNRSPKASSQTSPKISKDITNTELIRMSNFLTPATQNIINKLKHFKMSNGKVYAVNIGPYCAAKVNNEKQN